MFKHWSRSIWAAQFLDHCERLIRSQYSGLFLLRYVRQLQKQIHWSQCWRRLILFLEMFLLKHFEYRILQCNNHDLWRSSRLSLPERDTKHQYHVGSSQSRHLYCWGVWAIFSDDSDIPYFDLCLLLLQLVLGLFSRGYWFALRLKHWSQLPDWLLHI